MKVVIFTPPEKREKSAIVRRKFPRFSQGLISRIFLAKNTIKPIQFHGFLTVFSSYSAPLKIMIKAWEYTPHSHAFLMLFRGGEYDHFHAVFDGFEGGGGYVVWEGEVFV